ncbi:hypothetical protein CIPAW_10G102500 [Carya illinoinensis]|uniref:Uncharacterized protein n=1 Tax=Carya illinoinensis TaxID=32201 RepID=A0A8T1PCM9_CARIL|nr:hypothetical protein CIPAW_10G102500 [Carya illinoinensis]
MVHHGELSVPRRRHSPLLRADQCAPAHHGGAASSTAHSARQLLFFPCCAELLTPSRGSADCRAQIQALLWEEPLSWSSTACCHKGQCLVVALESLLQAEMHHELRYVAACTKSRVLPCQLCCTQRRTAAPQFPNTRLRRF